MVIDHFHSFQLLILTYNISKEAWFTPGKGLHSATGWLEERLRNVRRKCNQNLEKQKMSASQSSKLVKIPTLPNKSLDPLILPVFINKFCCLAFLKY